jgi:aminoglycoside 2''-phosphotransferase
MDPTASALASSIAGFLTDLHGWPIERTRVCGVAEEREPERTRALFDRVRDCVYPLLAPALRAWTDHLFGDALADLRLWDYVPALVHGDLSADHILFDPATWTLAGIIDFGDTAVGDPLGDFVGLAPYGKAFLEAVLAAYSLPLGVAARDRLAFYRRRLPFIALAWGAENSDRKALDHGMALLRTVVTAGSDAQGD